MHPARVTGTEHVGDYLGFPILRFELLFLEDGDEGATEVVAGRSALAMKPGDEVAAWTDDEGILAGVIHPGWPSKPEDAARRLATLLDAELDEDDENDVLQLTGELRGYDVVLVLDAERTVYLGVEAPFDAVDDEFELDFRHLFDPDDRMESEVTVRGDLVADLDEAGEAAGLSKALPDDILDRIDRLTQTIDSPLVVDSEGVSISLTAALFDGDLWLALLEELITLREALDAATR